MNIVIIDYGMGNIKSIISALNYLGINDVILSSERDRIKSADKIILPGVGSYGEAINSIIERNLDKYLLEAVVKNKKPLLGICLGMQLLGISSTEDGFNNGLGFIPGYVDKFDSSKIKVPHVGFNQVKVNNQLKLYKGFKENEIDFYFTHSYRMTSDVDINQCYCNYQSEFVASFEMSNIAGTQFHPELSQKNGLRVLKNFLEFF